MSDVHAEPKADRAGQFLRRSRARLGLTTREVAVLSQRVAEQQSRDEFSISHACLVQTENDQSVPSIFKLFTLSVIYGLPLLELLKLYLDVSAASRLHISLQHSSTHLAALDGPPDGGANTMGPAGGEFLESATRLAPEILRASSRLGMPFIEEGAKKLAYGLIGTSDYTMYPLIRPGSLVQIQDCHRLARRTDWRTEFDRPIYFIELRSGYICSWCEIADGKLISIPHPLSPCRSRQFSYPVEAEIIGRVTRVMLELDAQFAAGATAQFPRERLDPIRGQTANRTVG